MLLTDLIGFHSTTLVRRCRVDVIPDSNAQRCLRPLFSSPPGFYRPPPELAGALSVELGGHCYRELFCRTNRRPTIIAHPHLRAAIKFAVRSTSQRDGRLAEAAGGDAVVLAFPASHLLGMREALAPPGARLFRLSISIDHIKR